MKKISMILFSLLMIFSLGVEVFACDPAKGNCVSGAVTDSNKSEADDGHNADIKNSLPGWNGGVDPQILIGIRIGIVASDGTELKLTDYILQESRNKYATIDYSTQGSKAGYAANGGSVEPERGSGGVDFGNSKELENIFKKNGFNLDFSDDSKYVTADVDGESAKFAYDISQTNNWFDEDNHNSNRDYQEDLKGLLADLITGTGYDINDLGSLSDINIVVEPTTMMCFDGQKSGDGCYYGSIYELADTASKMDETVNGTYGKTGLTSFTTLFNNATCSSYLEGNIYDSMMENGESIDCFTEDTYFCNMSTNSGTYCTDYKNVPADVLIDPKSGIGVSVTWPFGNLKSEDDKILEELSCTKIKQYSGIEIPDVIYKDNIELMNKIVAGFNSWASANKYEKYKLDLEGYMGWCPPKNPPQLTCNFVNENSGVYSSKVYKGDSSSINNILSGFDAWAEKNGYMQRMDYNYYNENCTGEKPKEQYACEPIGGVGNCDASGVTYNDNSGYDEKLFQEQCVIGNSEYAEDSISQTYCKYYCYEKLDAKLVSFIKTVSAGRYIDFNEYTNKVSGYRKCVTKVDVNGYKNAIANAQKSIVESWRDIKANENFNAAIDNPVPQGQCCNTTEVCKKYKMQCDYNEETGEYDKNCKETNVCLEYDCPIGYETYYTYSASSVSISADGISVSPSGSISGGWCGTNKPAYKDTSTTSYDNNRKHLQGIVESMYKCYSNINTNSIYNLQPELKLDYTDGVTYTYASTLSKSVISDNASVVTSNKQDYVSKTYTCEGYKCTSSVQGVQTANGMMNVNVYEKIEAMRNLELSYGLNASTFNYVTKYKNHSQHTASTEEYITMGSNLPVAYAADGTGNHLSVLYSKFGHSGTGATRVDNYLSSISPNYGNWSCNFDITSDLILVKGINLIYRTIDLNNPFPDIDGTGRTSGSNWEGHIEEVITNHKDIYDNKPMYSFVLTPSTVKQIRSYNKSHPYDDFELSCVENTGTGCTSTFLTQVINQQFNNANDITDGACEDDRIRNLNDANKFNLCRYQGK